MYRMFVLLLIVCGWSVGVEAAVPASPATSFRWDLDVAVQRWQGALSGVRVAQDQAALQRQLDQVEKDLTDMKREYYSGRFSRVRPGLLMGIGGGIGIGLGASFLTMGLIFPYGAITGFLITAAILGTVGVICLIIGGVWMAKINRRRKWFLGLMNNARRKRYELRRQLGGTPGSGMNTLLSQPDHTRVGLVDLPQPGVSHLTVAF